MERSRGDLSQKSARSVTKRSQRGGLAELVQQIVERRVHFRGRIVATVGDFPPQLGDSVDPDFASASDRVALIETIGRRKIELIGL